MRIKSSLALGIVASLLVSLVIAGVAFFILRSMRIELERSRVYDEAMIKANALNVLLASLQEGSNASDLLQIQNVQASLNDLLDKMAPMDALEESLIRQIKRENETLRFLLDQVSVSGSGGRMVLDRERKEILDSQLWMKVRRIYDEIYRLRVMSRSRIDAAQANAVITVLFLLVTLIFSNTLISVLSGRKVVQSEESLRQSEENFRSLYNRTPVMLHSINPEGKIISVSDYWLETMGYSREEVLDRHISEFLTPDSRRETLEVNLPRFMQTGSARDIEYQLVKKSGEIMDVLLSAILEKDAAGAMVRTMGVVVDVTARKRAEAALRESQAILRTLIDANPEGLILMDPQGIVLAINETLARRLGKTAPELVGACIYDHIPPEVAARRKPLVAQVVASGEHVHFEDRRGERFIDNRIHPVRDRDGRVTRLAILGIDITDRRRAEEERDRLFNLSLDMMCIAGFDGFFKQVNPAWEKTLGWSDQELLNRPWLTMVHPADRAATIAAGFQLSAGEPVYGFENRYLCRDGSYRWFSWNSFPVLEEELIFCVVRDVTERKLTEEALRQEKQFTETVLESLPGVFYLFSADGKYLRWNSNLEHVTGYTAADFAGMLAWELFQGEDRERTCAAFHEALDLGEVIIEAQLAAKDGIQTPYLFTGRRAVLDGDTCVVGVGINLTERKEAEAALLREKILSDTIIESLPGVFYLYDEHLRFSRVNRRFEEVTGYCAAEIAEMSPLDFFAGPDKELLAQRIQQVFTEGEGYVEAHFVTKAGDRIPYDFTGARMTLGGRNYLEGVGIDITERQQAEAALRESEERFRTLVKLAPIPLCFVNREGALSYFNDRFIEVFGYTPEDVPTLKEWWQLAYPDAAYREWVRATWEVAVQKAAQTGADIQPIEYRVTCKNGAVRIMEISGITIGDTFLAIFIDLTERQQAEAALRESEELYRSLFDNMLNGLAYFKMLFEDGQPRDFTYLNVNRAFETLTGLQNVVGKNVSEVIPGLRESNPGMFEIFGRVALTGQPERFEDYVEPLQMWFALSVYSPAKEYFVVVFDVITDRKRAEAALRESEERFRLAFENANVGMTLVAPDGHHLQVNPALCDMWGYTREELEGMTIIDTTHPDDLPVSRDFISRALAGEYDRGRIEKRHLHKDGHTVLVQVATALIRDAQDRPRYFISHVVDITAQRQAEEELRRRVRDLAALYAASQAFLGQIGVAEALQETCRLAVEHFGLRLAWVGFTEPGKDYLVRPAAVSGDEAGYLNAIQVTWDDSPTGCGPGGVAIRTGQAMVINDTETDPAFVPWREAALARGYRSAVGLPIFYEKEVMGTLLLYSGEPGYFTADRLPVLQAFANQAAVALQKARLYEETRRYAAELENRVAERTAQLESTNMELDRFAYSVSHDLRAPLRAMQGFSLALLEDYAGELDPGGQDYARRINAAAERMDRLIQDLLAYSRISREEMALQPVNLEQAVAEAMAHVEGDIQARQARVRVEPPLPDVQANRAALLQIVANLVSNAIKFAAPEVQPQVRLWAEDRGERVRLWVEDNGLGIAPEHLERIFRIFERLHGVEAYPGTGIGLAIVKKGVERMGGQVGVESTPGQGSRFWVELEKAG
jgi:PAS domain S-box-containing protein